MASNPMLSSYRNATDVAGQYKKVGTNVGGVAAIMVDRSDGYGPSQHMFDSWKRSGIPTSELRQPTTFGMATVKGDTAGDCFTFGKLPQSTPSGKAVSHHAPRVNPITWAGGPEEPAPRRNYDPRTGRANGGRPVRRSTAFTSDFRDPFD